MKKKICSVGTPVLGHQIVISPVSETEWEKSAMALIQRDRASLLQIDRVAGRVAQHVPVLQWMTNVLNNPIVQKSASGESTRQSSLVLTRKRNLAIFFQRIMAHYLFPFENQALPASESNGFVAFRDVFSALLLFYSHDKCSPTHLFLENQRIPFLIKNLNPFWGVKVRHLYYDALPLTKLDKKFLKRSVPIVLSEAHIHTGTRKDIDVFIYVLTILATYFPEFDLLAAIPDLETRFGVSWTPIKDPTEDARRLERLMAFSESLAFKPSEKQKPAYIRLLTKYVDYLPHFEGKIPNSAVCSVSLKAALVQFVGLSIDGNKSFGWDIQYKLICKMLTGLFPFAEHDETTYPFLIEAFVLASSMVFLQNPNGYAGFTKVFLPNVKTRLKQVDGKPDEVGLGQLRAASLWVDVLKFVSEVTLSYQDMDVRTMLFKLNLLEKMIADSDLEDVLMTPLRIFKGRQGSFLKHQIEDNPELESMARCFSIMPGYPRPVFRFRVAVSKLMFEREAWRVDLNPDESKMVLRKALYYSALDVVLKNEDGDGLAKLVVYMTLNDSLRPRFSMLPWFAMHLKPPKKAATVWDGFVMNVLSQQINMGSLSIFKEMPPELKAFFKPKVEVEKHPFWFSPDLPEEATVHDVLNSTLMTAEGPVVFEWRDTEANQMATFLEGLRTSDSPEENTSIFGAFINMSILMTTKNETLLHFAAKAKDRDAMLKLVRLGYSLDWEDMSGKNAYTHAPDEAAWVCQEMLQSTAEPVSEAGVAAVAEPVPDSPEVQLKNLRKNRKLMKGLLEMGFSPLSAKRGKGSHQLFSNEEGTTITVPHHAEIKPGTLGAILNKAKG